MYSFRTFPRNPYSQFPKRLKPIDSFILRSTPNASVTNSNSMLLFNVTFVPGWSFGMPLNSFSFKLSSVFSTWVWFRLYGRVKPLLAKGKEQEQLEKLTEELSSAKENLVKGKQVQCL